MLLLYHDSPILKRLTNPIPLQACLFMVKWGQRHNILSPRGISIYAQSSFCIR